MVTLAAAALSEPGLPPPVRARLEQIIDQAEWLADLVQHSMHANGPGVPAACKTDLSRVVNEAAAAERVTWAGHMRIMDEGEPVFTVVHAVLLRRMIANLLGNATRAAGPSGTVTIEIGRHRRLAILVIEDTGPGFGKIERGLGLGLGAVSKCAATYGGGLQCGCGSSGGARVRLWLPHTPSAARNADGDRKAAGTLSAAPQPGGQR